MRLSLGAYAALGLGLVFVTGTLFLHAWSCSYRLRRACRLYEAGRIGEGDRVVAAVERSVVALRRRHPVWRLTADRVREMPA